MKGIDMKWRTLDAIAEQTAFPFSVEHRLYKDQLFVILKKWCNKESGDEMYEYYKDDGRIRTMDHANLKPNWKLVYSNEK
jgi:hypothetical protein